MLLNIFALDPTLACVRDHRSMHVHADHEPHVSSVESVHMSIKHQNAS